MAPNFERNRKLANLIVLMYLIGFAYFAYFVLRITWYWSKVPEQFQMVVKGVPSATWVFSALVVALNLFGAIQLSRMKRSSRYLLLAGLLGVVAQYFDVLGLALPYSTPIRPTQWFGLAGGALVCLYAWYLYKTGLLK